MKQSAWVSLVLGLTGAALAVAPSVATELDCRVNTTSRVEVVDHVVPGLVVVVIALAILSCPLPAHALDKAYAGAALPGAWVLFTHVALALQAMRGEVESCSAVIHFGSGLLPCGAALTGFALARRAEDAV